MLEAVNSVLSNASYTRVVTEQQSVVNSYAANPERVQQAPVQAPYISLYIKVDNNFDKAVLQIRDNQSGDVVRQIPTESQLEAYRRAQTSNSVRARTAEEEAAIVRTTENDVPVQNTTSPQTQPVVTTAPSTTLSGSTASTTVSSGNTTSAPESSVDTSV